MDTTIQTEETKEIPTESPKDMVWIPGGDFVQGAVEQDKMAMAHSLELRSPFLEVKKGQVAGIVQTGTGYRGDEALIVLHMEAYLGAPESYDAVIVSGSPNLHMKIAGGVHGDVATASITVNSIPKVLHAAPGLQTMRSMELPSYYGGK